MADRSTLVIVIHFTNNTFRSCFIKQEYVRLGRVAHVSNHSNCIMEARESEIQS